MPDEKIIAPVLVGLELRIRSVAAEAGLDLGGCEILDAASEEEAAAAAVRLVRAGQAHSLMKGSLHTDVMMHAVVTKEGGLRTARRISHVFLIDVPTYPDVLFVTDAAINIFPDLGQARHRAERYRPPHWARARRRASTRTSITPRWAPTTSSESRSRSRISTSPYRRSPRSWRLCVAALPRRARAPGRPRLPRQQRRAPAEPSPAAPSREDRQLRFAAPHLQA
jgi:phosphate acetyl/butyryl transferase